MKIRLLPDHIEFDQLPNRSLLESALRAGLKLNHGCANGACGLCKVRKIEGDVIKVQAHDAILTPSERNQGVLLLCSYAAAGDVLLEEFTDTPPRVIARQRIETRVRKVEPLGAGTLILHVRTPRSSTFRYHAGQRARLALPHGLSRELAVASCPCEPMNLQFHVQADAERAFFDAVRGLRPSDPITLTGPEGDFTFHESNGRRLIFVAYEHGFAPIKSLLEHALSLELPQRVDIVWIAGRPDGHYLDNYCRSVSDALDNVTYWPLTLATPTPSELKLALRAVLESCVRLTECDVYLAAPENIASAAREIFVGAGLSSERYFSEIIPPPSR